MEQPKEAGKEPHIVQLDQGKAYAWCSCGKSEKQPWCNGMHAGSKFTPKVITAEESKTAAICMCKRTKNPPYCDGAHTKL